MALRDLSLAKPVLCSKHKHLRYWAYHRPWSSGLLLLIKTLLDPHPQFLNSSKNLFKDPFHLQTLWHLLLETEAKIKMNQTVVAIFRVQPVKIQVIRHFWGLLSEVLKAWEAPSSVQAVTFKRSHSAVPADLPSSGQLQGTDPNSHHPYQGHASHHICGAIPELLCLGPTQLSELLWPIKGIASSQEITKK